MDEPNTMFKKLLSILLLLALPGPAWAQVDLNRADAKTLAVAMSGVGLVKAEAIVAYRNAHGPFRHVEDLAKVRGIGAKTISANRDAVVVIEAEETSAQPGDERPHPPAAR